jgi:predicted dehydrogenase
MRRATGTEVATPVRLALIGCGRLAERGWIPAIARTAGAELVAVADRDSARCPAVAPGVRAFEGATGVVEAGGVDAVIIATPATDHLSDATACAEAGLPALVEKPPAANTAEARALAALAPLPRVGFNRRFDRRILRLRSALPASGELGIGLTFDYTRAAWSPHVVDDDALLDVGCHLLDLARWLTESDVLSVRSSEIAQERALLEARLPRGRAMITCNAAARYREVVDVRTAHGQAIACSRRGGHRDVVVSTLRRLAGGSALIASLAAELAAFCAVVRGEAVDDLATAVDGAAVMEAIEGARESALLGGAWVSVADTPPAH